MKSVARFFQVSLAVVAILQATNTIASAQFRPNHVPGEFLVQFRQGVSAAEIGPAIADVGKGRVLHVYKRLNTVHIRLPDAKAAQMSAFRTMAQKNPNVALIEPNYLYYANKKPDDPKLDELWFLKNIAAYKAWDLQSESSSVIVAVIDTGVFLGHEDLKGNIWRNPREIPGNNKDDDKNGYKDDVHGWDFYNNDNDPVADRVPVDMFPPFCIPHETKKRFEAHGTHVAGTIGAVGNNKKGIVGISWKIEIMPLKFLGGVCGSGSSANAIKAIEYAVANGARIINCSWGGGPYSQFLKNAIDDAHKSGVLVIAAAGNAKKDNDSDPHYPSSYSSPNIIAVAATNQDDGLASFSHWGEKSVDLAAPGVAVMSTIPTGDETTPKPGSGYDAFSGTSMATPVVSGVAALVMARYPTLTHTEVKRLIVNTVDPVPELAGKVLSGGRLNAFRALNPPLPGPLARRIRELPLKYQKVFQEHPEIRVQYFLNPATLRNGSWTAQPMGKKAMKQRHDILIGLKAGMASDQIPKFVAPYQVERVEIVSRRRNVYRVILRCSSQMKDVISDLKDRKAFYHVEKNVTYKKNG